MTLNGAEAAGHGGQVPLLRVLDSTGVASRREGALPDSELLIHVSASFVFEGLI